MKYDTVKVVATADEGSELNCLDFDFASENNIPIESSSELARAAGSTKLNLIGETATEIVLYPVHKEKIRWALGRCIVVQNLGVPILIGEPGKMDNRIRTVSHEKEIITETTSGKPVAIPYLTAENIRGINKSFLLRSKENQYIFPKDSQTISLPQSYKEGSTVFIVPRKNEDWITPTTKVVQNNSVTISNDSDRIVQLKKNQHYADVFGSYQSTFKAVKGQTRAPQEVESVESKISKIYELDRENWDHFIQPDRPNIDTKVSYIEDVQVDPDNQLTNTWKQRFTNLCEEYTDIITPIPGRYNGHFGHVDNSLHFTSTPPATNRARLPTYSTDMLKIQANLMDKMEDWGVLVKPEKIGVVPAFVVPSMLVVKDKQGSREDPLNYRLVSDFTGLNQYIKKAETVMPTIKETKQKIGMAEYLVELDFSQYYWQGGMLREDCQYLATPHPYNGLYVYQVEPQGLRNASEHGDERLARIYGDMDRDNKCCRYADGMYVLGNTLEELESNLREVFRRTKLANLTLKPSKLIICPETTILFGERKEKNEWKPTTHVINPLTNAPPPTTTRQMRSFIGAYRQLSEFVQGYAILLKPLEISTRGKKSQEKIIWTEQLKLDFERAKDALRNPKSVTIPRPSDHLHFYPDTSTALAAVGAWLGIDRIDDKGNRTKHFGGYFNQCLDAQQKDWLPCEREALGARLIVQHWSHYIRESKNTSIIHLDNLPTVQAWKRLKLGIFSNSSRVSAFCSAMGSHDVELRHYPGVRQQLADFGSRQPEPCKEKRCQVCHLAFEIEGTEHVPMAVASIKSDTWLRTVTVNDILSGNSRIPYTQRPAWLKCQKEDPVHRKLVYLIENGQRPEPRKTKGNSTTLKRLFNLYKMNLLRKASDGLVTVKHIDARAGEFEAISVPTDLYPGLIQALHLNLGHPSRTQLMKVANRHFYCCASSRVIDEITNACSVCNKLKHLPTQLMSQTTEQTPVFATNFSADIIKQHNQLIFLIREKLSQYVSTEIIEDETADTLREAIIKGVIDFIPADGCVIQVDPAPAFQTLHTESTKIEDNGSILKRFGIKIDVGRILNKNKNPIAENAVQEWLKERLKLKPDGGPITENERSEIQANMNRRIRQRGLAAKEILLRRDLNTNEPKSFSDSVLSEDQLENRRKNHPTISQNEDKDPIRVGDFVFIRDAKSKIKGREAHVVTSLFERESEKYARVRKCDKSFRSKEYDAKTSELFKIPFSEVEPTQEGQSTADDETETDSSNEEERGTTLVKETAQKRETKPPPSSVPPKGQPAQGTANPFGDLQLGSGGQSKGKRDYMQTLAPSKITETEQNPVPHQPEDIPQDDTSPDRVGEIPPDRIVDIPPDRLVEEPDPRTTTGRPRRTRKRINYRQLNETGFAGDDAYVQLVRKSIAQPENPLHAFDYEEWLLAWENEIVIEGNLTKPRDPVEDDDDENPDRDLPEVDEDENGEEDTNVGNLVGHFFHDIVPTDHLPRLIDLTLDKGKLVAQTSPSTNQRDTEEQNGTNQPVEEDYEGDVEDHDDEAIEAMMNIDLSRLSDIKDTPNHLFERGSESPVTANTIDGDSDSTEENYPSHHSSCESTAWDSYSPPLVGERLTSLDDYDTLDGILPENTSPDNPEYQVPKRPPINWRGDSPRPSRSHSLPTDHDIKWQNKLKLLKERWKSLSSVTTSEKDNDPNQPMPAPDVFQHWSLPESVSRHRLLATSGSTIVRHQPVSRSSRLPRLAKKHHNYKLAHTRGFGDDSDEETKNWKRRKKN